MYFLAILVVEMLRIEEEKLHQQLHASQSMISNRGKTPIEKNLAEHSRETSRCDVINSHQHAVTDG